MHDAPSWSHVHLLPSLRGGADMQSEREKLDKRRGEEDRSECGAIGGESQQRLDQKEWERVTVRDSVMDAGLLRQERPHWIDIQFSPDPTYHHLTYWARVDLKHSSSIHAGH